MSDWIGRQVGKYEISELLGRGGMMGPEVIPDKMTEFEFTFEIAASCGEAP